MKKLLVLLFSILILPVSVNAADVYYCSDDQGVGFIPEENFKIEHYTSKDYYEKTTRTSILKKFEILIDLENKNVISNDLMMDKSIFNQECLFDEVFRTLYCVSALGRALSINTLNLRYVRSIIFNKRNQKDDFVIAYGTCEKI